MKSYTISTNVIAILRVLSWERYKPVCKMKSFEARKWDLYSYRQMNQTYQTINTTYVQNQLVGLSLAPNTSIHLSVTEVTQERQRLE